MSIIATKRSFNRELHLFSNGLRLSVIWGFGSYTKYRNLPYNYEVKDPNEFEVALMDGLDWRFVGQEVMPDEFSGDDVCGWLSTEDLSKLIDRIGNLKYVHPFSIKMIKILFFHYYSDLRDKLKSCRKVYVD